MVDSWISSISLTGEFVRNGEIWPRHIESICILSWFLDDSVLQPKLRLSRTQGKEARSWPPRGHCLNSGSKWCFSFHSPHPVRYQVLIYFPFKQISLVSHKLVPDKHLPSSLRAAAEINPFTTSAQKISRDPYFHHFRCEFLHLNTRPSHIWLQVTCLTWFPLCISLVPAGLFTMSQDASQFLFILAPGEPSPCHLPSASPNLIHFSRTLPFALNASSTYNLIQLLALLFLTLLTNLHISRTSSKTGINEP